MRTLGEIMKRQAERRAAVEEAHRRSTVWCCATEAEECFDDLETVLLQILKDPATLPKARKERCVS
jgi:hypothetical protein